jgi:aspartyl/asparaginyl-tRNA synthetase
MTECCKSSRRDLVRLKAQVVDTIRDVMRKRGAVESYYPKITGGTGACENVPTAFVLSNTAQLSYLSQTDQLLMEAEILEYGIPEIWTVGRSYRNEPRAGDGRHLAEFALLEFEARNMDLDGLVAFQHELLVAVINAAISSPIISPEHRKRLERYAKASARVVEYTDIVRRLQDGGVSINWGDDFSSTVEEMVCLMYEGPVMVIHYPESLKFFNMYRSTRAPLEPNLPIEEYNKQRWTVDCVDCLLPWAGETFGGSRREESYATLSTKLRESRMFKQMAQLRAAYENNGEMTPEVEEASWQPFVSYLKLFEKRTDVARSGFGLGMGRLVQFLLGETQVVVF